MRILIACLTTCAFTILQLSQLGTTILFQSRDIGVGMAHKVTSKNLPQFLESNGKVN